MDVFSSVRLSTNLMFIMIFGVFKQAPLYFNTNMIKSQTVKHMCRCACGLTFTWWPTKVRWSPPLFYCSSYLLSQTGRDSLPHGKRAKLCRVACTGVARLLLPCWVKQWRQVNWWWLNSSFHYRPVVCSSVPVCFSSALSCSLLLV